MKTFSEWMKLVEIGAGAAVTGIKGDGHGVDWSYVGAPGGKADPLASAPPVKTKKIKK